MSPSNGPPNVSPSAASNHNREASGSSGRTFSSPDAHRPSSTNNTDPLISPNVQHLGPQSFFPPQQQPQPPLASMRPPTPGSPNQQKSAKNNNGSILERALASTIKQEAASVQPPASVASIENCLNGPQMEHWPPQAQPQQPE